ncbi:outer membrane protein assembly factor BamB family protein [Streptoalloteichus hindustanus]|uniref:PQQ-like domain-containing protein n=1 Tax=Streptoalloteichus hindustanus TaxID=2017 RepID=A0A1M5BFR4_STRHI|nr:PQQ-binding-like beta-propeller repeat protein [Streptoalloteichus hindustanus]SHF41167.1 PQQ-like domain-containing protein [Streptoalloteichus hindustanus]
MSPRFRTVLACVLAAVAVSACAHVDRRGGSLVAPTPQSSAPAVGPVVPPTLRAEPLWTAPFVAAPEVAGQVFVGVVAAPDGSRAVAAVDDTGHSRWSVPLQREPSRFAVTRVGDRDVVVVLDTAADRTSASAYEAASGDRLWGPTDVPGAWVGPGLVLAGPSGRVALDAGSGRVAVREEPGARVLQEHDGTVVLERDGRLLAVDAATGVERWSPAALVAPDRLGGTGAEPRYRAEPGDDAVLFVEWTVGTPGAPRALGYSAHDVRTGALVGDVPHGGAAARAMVDRTTGVTLLFGPTADTLVTAVDGESRRTLWRRPAGQEPVRFTFAAGGVAYGTVGARTVAVDERTGEIRGGGRWRLPVAAVRSGVTLVPVADPSGRDRFLAFRRG